METNVNFLLPTCCGSRCPQRFPYWKLGSQGHDIAVLGHRKAHRVMGQCPDEWRNAILPEAGDFSQE